MRPRLGWGLERGMKWRGKGDGLLPGASRDGVVLGGGLTGRSQEREPSVGTKRDWNSPETPSRRMSRCPGSAATSCSLPPSETHARLGVRCLGNVLADPASHLHHAGRKGMNAPRHPIWGDLGGSRRLVGEVSRAGADNRPVHGLCGDVSNPSDGVAVLRDTRRRHGFARDARLAPERNHQRARHHQPIQCVHCHGEPCSWSARAAMNFGGRPGRGILANLELSGHLLPWRLPESRQSGLGSSSCMAWHLGCISRRPGASRPTKRRPPFRVERWK